MMYFLLKRSEIDGKVRTVIQEGPLQWRDMAYSMLAVQFDPDTGDFAVIKNRNGGCNPPLDDQYGA